MNWIKKSVNKSKSFRNHYKMHDIDIYIKDPISDGINIDFVFKTISKTVPAHLLSGVDIVYIGEFDMFKKKHVNALYQDSAIYLTNIQETDEDMIDDIVHEIAHSVEETYGNIIYDDSSLRREFLGKRERLFSILSANGLKPPQDLRKNYHYDKNIDIYLYKSVGYKTMWGIINGLFLSPYSTTSLREYFAIGFEEYFMRNRNTLRTFCPYLYSKLETLEYMEKK